MVDYSSIANNSALLAAILTPLLGYLHKESQTYYLDLLAVPFIIFLLTVATSTIVPNDLSVWLFVIGIAIEIGLYLMIALESLDVEKQRLT